MLAIASSLGMFQIVMRFVLEQPCRVDRSAHPLQPHLDGVLAIPAAFRQGRW